MQRGAHGGSGLPHYLQQPGTLQHGGSAQYGQQNTPQRSAANQHHRQLDPWGSPHISSSTEPHNVASVIKKMQASLDEKDYENRTLQAQLRMATEKAQMDLIMQKAETDRKVASLVEKMRVQRRGLEVAKEELASMTAEFSQMQSLCYELSHGMFFIDSRFPVYTSQRTSDQLQKPGDSIGEVSSQSSWRSAAGTVLGSDGESEPFKLLSAHSRIRRLEAELAISQTRSERIAGLEDEMEAYTAIQDEKIQEMQFQIRDLHNKLEAERHRNEELAQQHTELWSSIAGAEKGLPASISRSSRQMTNVSEMDGVGSAERDKAALSPFQVPSTHRCHPNYNPIETRERGKEREEEPMRELIRLGRSSVSELASKFESKPVAGCGYSLAEKEITNSPRLRVLPSSAMGGGSAQQSFISVSKGKQDSKGRQPIETLNQSADLPKSSGRSQSLDSSNSYTVDTSIMTLSTLDHSHAECNVHNGQQEGSNPTQTRSTSSFDRNQTNRIVGQGISSAAPHAAHSLPRVLQVQGSDQVGMVQMHRQLMFKGHVQPPQSVFKQLSGLPYA